jgi:transposase InsO family protein
MVRRLKRMGPQDVRLCAAATRLRLLPPLRAAWARVGKQAVVPVTGRNARRVLFGALNGRTAHRIILRWPSETSPGARAFLTEIRRRYRGAPTIWLLLDQGPAHTAAPTRRLAAELGIEFVWLPRPWPEGNAMDQLWREWKKRLVAANRQAASIEDLAQQAEDWVLGLGPQEALRQAGILSPRFWLKSLLQSLWLPT